MRTKHASLVVGLALLVPFASVYGEERAPVSNEARAAIVNSFRVPGKGLLCVAGSAVSVAVLLVTGGFGYRAADGIFDESCGGPWLVKAEDLRPVPEVSRAFEWERHRFDWEPPLDRVPRPAR